MLFNFESVSKLHVVDDEHLFASFLSDDDRRKNVRAVTGEAKQDVTAANTAKWGKAGQVRLQLLLCVRVAHV